MSAHDDRPSDGAPSEQAPPAQAPPVQEPPLDSAWDGRAVRALRERLGETQAAFADRIGTTQQTVSGWERGARAPRRMARRLLHLVAEQAATYDAGPRDRPPDG